MSTCDLFTPFPENLTFQQVIDFQRDKLLHEKQNLWNRLKVLQISNVNRFIREKIKIEMLVKLQLLNFLFGIISLIKSMYKRQVVPLSFVVNLTVFTLQYERYSEESKRKHLFPRLFTCTHSDSRADERPSI